MSRRSYFIFLVTISVLFTCFNVFYPTTRNALTEHKESTFSAVKQLMGFEPMKDTPKPRKRKALPIRKTSQPLSECPQDNLNNSLDESTSFPLIAVMAASVTRGVAKPSVRSLALFSHLWPSLITSLDCGFRYVFILGYDEGDEFYDTETGMNKTQTWFEKHIRKSMERRNIVLNLVTLKVANQLKKPGPVFIAMGKEAYQLGADFMYRVNDDTYVQGNWASFFVSRLMSLTPPYGVIGPSSVATDDRILTHDFVHKTHLEIFQMDYYPHQLTDWWMDDWISHVYGRERTFITKPGGSIDVVHYVFKHQRRYKVDYAHENLLPELVLAGQQAVFEWMILHPAVCPPNVLNSFRESCVQYGERDKNGLPKPVLNVARVKSNAENHPKTLKVPI